MPTMDHNIGELQVMVDKMSREIDKETKKREAAVREKDVANEKLYLYQQVYDTLKIADPE